MASSYFEGCFFKLSILISRHSYCVFVNLPKSGIYFSFVYLQVKTWFQNRRMKHKKLQRKPGEEDDVIDDQDVDYEQVTSGSNSFSNLEHSPPSGLSNSPTLSSYSGCSSHLPPSHNFTTGYQYMIGKENVKATMTSPRHPEYSLAEADNEEIDVVSDTD